MDNSAIAPKKKKEKEPKRKKKSGASLEIVNILNSNLDGKFLSKSGLVREIEASFIY